MAEVFNNSNASFDVLVDAIFGAVTSLGVERPIEDDSLLAREIGDCESNVSAHFLGELPRHCAMLVVAAADACAGLSGLSPANPFSSIVVARGLMEAMADLHWLSESALGSVERARRACLVFLRQTETAVRKLTALRDRQADDGAIPVPQLDEAIREGWEDLRATAHEMSAAGYPLRTSRKPGSKYYLDEMKPPISHLVDGVIAAFYGSTPLNIYSLYSSVAHVEGEGLGTLLDWSDSINSDAGLRYRYGFTSEQWLGNVIKPGFVVAAQATREWLVIAYPSQLAGFDEATQPVLERLLAA